ncbi:MAG TPA: T9SS type A sorting domain-containing protein [Bacteroidia bacterium]|nr:T9SS type A sorting domain-containing protein [Bacteroidia bacterium]HNT79859.1 T9SS type A sorting domain-containing protein [Bacteroidia bacterium]
MTTTIRLFLSTVVLIVCSFHVNAQVYNMSNGTVNTCGGTFYDNGGSAADYSNNSNLVQTFCSSSGNCLRVTFNSFRTQGGNDILYVYDGPNTASPLIGTFSGNANPGTLISTSGCLTFRFTSNGNVTRQGWSATISCSPCNTGYLMSNSSVTTCGALFYDGGGASSNYSSNSNQTMTFNSANGAGTCIKVVFTSFNTQSGFDVLHAYDGTTTSSPFIGSYSGSTLPPSLLASSGSITFRFVSNNSNNRPGWSAIISCEVCPSNPGTPNYLHPTVGLQNTYVGTPMVNTCGGTYSDNGGSSGNYDLNINSVYRTFCPDQAGMCMRVQFQNFSLEPGYDGLTILNGPTQWSPQFPGGSAFTGTCNSYQQCMGAGLGPFTSTDESGCLTFVHYSDFSITYPGWVATFNCVPCNYGPSGISNSDCGNFTAICSDSSFSDASTGPGLVSDGNTGCVLSENYSNWYQIRIQTSGTLGLNIVPNVTADDYDFSIYGPNTTCGNLGAPVRCSYASNTGTTGLNAIATDQSEDVLGDGWVQDMPVLAGEVYYVLINKWTPGGAGFTLNWVLSNGASLDCSITLPVEWLDFSAIPKTNEVLLKWTTATEWNSDYFEVERSSDGYQFKSIGSKKASGNSSSILEYSFSDDQPVLGLSYYRLKQVDLNGEFEYSKTLAIQYNGQALYQLKPNPANDKTHVVFYSDDGEQLDLVVRDTRGNIVYQTTLTGMEGINQFSLDLELLPKGFYTVELRNQMRRQISKLIKI